MRSQGKLLPSVLFTASALLVLIGSVEAWADPIGFEVFAYMITAFAIMVFIPYCIATILIEAWVLCRLLDVRYRRAAEYSLLANLASLAIGALWYA